MKFLARIFLVLTVPIMIVSCQKDDNDPDNSGDNGDDFTFDHTLSAGSSAEFFLSDENFDKLSIEIRYAKGYEPSSATLDNLRSFLQSHVNKPDGIAINMSEIPVSGDQAYSLAEIIDLEDKERDLYTTKNSLACFIFFADGDYEGNSGDSKTLGVAYRNTSAALFEKTIREYSGGLNQPTRTKLESTVLNHELGHLMGLVNNGSPMQGDHHDEAHGKHCDVSDCLMHYTVETTDIVDNLIGSGIPGLDSQCKADLQANGGK